MFVILSNYLCIFINIFFFLDNIDVTAFVLEYNDDVIFKNMDNIWSGLKLKLLPSQPSTRRRVRSSFFGGGGHGSKSLNDIINDEDYLSAMVSLEYRMFNFIYQWAKVRVQTHGNDPDIIRKLQKLLNSASNYCGVEKAEPLNNFVKEYSKMNSKLRKDVSFSDIDDVGKFIPHSITELW